MINEILYKNTSIDKNKFGDLSLSEKTKKYIEYNNLDLKDWQIDYIINDEQKFYKNPVYTIIKKLQEEVQGIINKYNIPIDGDNVGAHTILALQLFLEHTDYLSGIKKPKDNETPYLDELLSLGKNMLLLTNKTDNTEDSLPLIAGFSSLYCEDELNQYYENIIKINDINVLDELQNLKNFLNLTRNSDINYYQNAKSIQDKMSDVSKFNYLGSTHKKLITDVIGTEQLKSNLQSNVII